MDDKDRKEEKLDEIRRRVRLAEEREKRGEADPGPDRERGPAVTWHSAEQDRSRERGPTWTPRAEAFERSGHRIFRLELPGVDKDDAEVRIEGNRLIVEGERRRDEENDREEFRSEWPYGKFYRAFSLPYPVDPSDVKARYRNGVLDIAVPQPAREGRRRAIKVEG